MLGLVGLIELYGNAIIPVNLAIVSAYLTRTGAFVLFGGIALIGIGLIIGGLATMGEEEPKPIVQKEVVVVQPSSIGVGYDVLSDLELSVLRLLYQGKNEEEITRTTGVACPIIADKIRRLYELGYITDKNALTEKGYEALRLANQQVVVKPGV